MKHFKATFGLGTKQLWITSDWNQYAGWVKKHIGADEKDPVPELQGRCYGSFIWLRRPKYLPVLIHELTHAVDFWMTEIGIDVGETEVRAYAIEGLLTKYAKHARIKL